MQANTSDNNLQEHPNADSSRAKPRHCSYRFVMDAAVRQLDSGVPLLSEKMPVSEIKVKEINNIPVSRIVLT
jgi:hypothetical protein